ncbi:MAG: hypothetical protein QM722_08045 [Piscinibacter sp.]
MSGALVRGFAHRTGSSHWDHSDIGVINSGWGGDMSSKSSSVPWWSALGFGKAAPAPDTDYADMGTAFGLDASMDTLPMPDERSASSIDKGRAPSAGAAPAKKR